jgi:hypothetical protein
MRLVTSSGILDILFFLIGLIQKIVVITTCYLFLKYKNLSKQNTNI